MEPTTPNTQNKFAVPIAIILAGALVATAIYFTRGGDKTVSDAGKNVQGSQVNQDVTIAPVTASDHILGNPTAPIVIVEYSDTECPFCKTFHSTLQKVMSSYGKDGKVAWVYRHFPLYKGTADRPPLHSRAGKEAEATECANELGGNNTFWKYIDAMFATTTSNNTLDPAALPVIAKNVGLNVKAFQVCLDSGKYASVIENAYNAAVKVGARGTPYNVLILAKAASTNTSDFINSAVGQLGIPPNYLYLTPDKKKLVMSGALPYELVSKIIDTILAN